MNDIVLYGDVYASLSQLEDNSVSVVITSPPYWKQRDYGFPEQIGQENSPEEYIGRLRVIFSKLKQKIKDDGIFFLNIGDKYLDKYGKSHLLQIPYRLAYHMIRDGWFLEDIIIWYKPNHMPSPVRDRFTQTYEPVLVFSKSKNNIYKKGLGNVIKIPLEQTPWEHTAVFPEKLVIELLNRVELRDGDLILDPFAGTGTVGVAVKKLRNQLFFSRKINYILVEKGDLFINIIKNRIGVTTIKKIDDIPYEWVPVKEEDFPSYIKPEPVLTDKYGEVFIADTSEEFLSKLKGITTNEFKSYHREDALYFFGVKNWDIRDLYYIHSIFNHGYVLRNMLVVSEGMNWYPIFMFAKDTKRVAYRFYLDRVRVNPKSEEERDWWGINFIGTKVNDAIYKTEGKVIEIIERYDDGFPKIVIVQWNESLSAEFVLHPKRDEYIMESLTFRCPKCGNILEEPFDPIGKNLCPYCKAELWTSVETLPRIEEPKEILDIYKKIREINLELDEITKKHVSFEELKENKNNTIKRSKFAKLSRINWGASPGARKLMLGEYFTKTRLYRVEQPIVAQYLTILRKHNGLSIQDIVKRFPPSYKHTVGHWFRKDFGGSIPIPEDIPLLKEILADKYGLLDALERTALKLQTVKPSIKGKNPGDFIEGMSKNELINYLKILYLPSLKYIKTIQP